MLTPAANLGKHQLGEARDPPGGRLQCLRCGHEFKPEEPRSGLDGGEGWRPLFRKTGTSPALDPPYPRASCCFRENGFEVGVGRGSPRAERSGDQLFCVEEKLKPKKERKEITSFFPL